MSYLIKPAKYKAILNLPQTEMGIKVIKEFFQQNLSSELRLRRVTAPLFVLKGMGINDDLNGVERAVTFPIKDLGDAKAEIVHSLAKWKRLTLADYHIEEGWGKVIHTYMSKRKLTKEMVEAFVDSILIHGKYDYEIKLVYDDQFAELQKIMKEKEAQSR